MLFSNIYAISILAVILVAMVEGHPGLKEFEECLEIHNLTKDDFKNIKKDDTLSEAHLCVIKCYGEKTNELNSDGTINIEKLEKNPLFLKLSESDQEKSKQCLKDLGKIVECADIEKTKICFLDIELEL